MMDVHVRAEAIGKKLHRLSIFIDAVEIGEYERSQEADIDRKVKEITDSKALLFDLFQKHGQLKVRWNGKLHKKTIRREDGVEIGEVPKSDWGRPSWLP